MMPPEHFLTGRYPETNILSILLPRESWRPFPAAEERAAWQGLSQPTQEALLAAGEEALATAWPHLPADVYLEFSIDGNRTHYETPYFERRDLLTQLALAECVEGRGRFLSGILNALWSICEESSWCLPAHIAAQKAGPGLPDTTEPVLDLFAAETGALLAWAVYLLGPRLDGISPLVLPRVWREVDARVCAPALVRDDLWWMGFRQRPVNNWNPWICSNWLSCTLLLEPDAGRRAHSVFKALRCLDNFLVDYPSDGGCDEGPSYWGRAGASLFDCLELLHSATDGKVDVYGESLVREIGRFIYRAHIAGDYYLNFADAPAALQPEAMLVYRFGRRIQDPLMAGFGSWLARGEDASRSSSSMQRILPELFQRAELEVARPEAPLLRDVWLPETQVMAARDRAGNAEGFYMAAKGGHNAESHNHNDVGHFVVYHGGRPLIVDAGVGTYTRKTFSPQRYEIWTMQSAFHSLPTIDGVMQSPGREFAARGPAYRAEDARAEFQLDITAAYPPEAGVVSWVRRLALERGREVRLVDAYSLARDPKELTLSLVTPCQVDLSAAGKAVLGVSPLASGRVSAQGEIAYDPAEFEVRVEEVPLEDERLTEVWGPRLRRILLAVKSPRKQGEWRISIMG